MIDPLLHEGCRAVYRRVLGVASDGRLEGLIVRVEAINDERCATVLLPINEDKRLSGMRVLVDRRLLVAISPAR
jgi:hypothetical protein